MQSLHDHIATVFPEICATKPGAGSPGSGEQIEFVSRSELAPEEGLDTDGEGPKETKVEKAVTTPDKTGIINPEIAAMQEQIASLTALVTKMASEPDPNQAKPKGTAGLVVAEKVAHRTPDEVQQDVRSRETFEEQMQRRAMEQMALYSSDPSIREAALKALREVQKTG